MDKNPTVSVITTCRNALPFVRECIDSVLAQNYANIEHIIQDAASTDGTKEVLEEYAQKYPSIKLVSERDNGQCDGLNRAIQRSTGNVLLVLNADDSILPHACLWAVEQLEKNPDVAVVYGDVYIIDEQGKIISYYEPPDAYNFDALLCVELVPPAQAAFIRRSHFEQVGFYADAELDTCPDYEMFVRIGSKFPMLYVPNVVTKYRVYDSVRIDSNRKRSIDRFVRAKEAVAEKFLQTCSADTQTRLQRRMHVGLRLWATKIAFREEGAGVAIAFFKEALTLSPTWRHKFFTTLNMISGFLSYYSRRTAITKRLYRPVHQYMEEKYLAQWK